MMIKTGHKIGGGPTLMPPRTGQKIGGGLTAMPPRLYNTGAKTAAGLNTSMTGSPSLPQNVSCPGWNPGAPLIFAKSTLCDS